MDKIWTFSFQNQNTFFRFLKKGRGGLLSPPSCAPVIKVYHSIPYELLIAKLEAHGFHKNSLILLADYFSGRKRRMKIGSAFSELWKIICGIPQRSVLGSLLFNIFINDLLFFVLKCNICNFTDDNTMYSCNRLLSKILVHLRFHIKNVLNAVLRLTH